MASVLNKYVGEFSREKTTGGGFFIGGSVIMNYGLVFWLSRSECLKLIHLNDGFVSYKHAGFCFTKLIDGLELL